ncbi:FecR family protein [Thalassomonas actiniarum]|uniref:FecR domain-containing protein n=1 Tax=Thalassomonas actiniarum TaxID=485447 RepID=A0AAE9YM69_9GAMM|nr:FecR domain-containing protein [Thalassomonas actiniarum]WDD97497.1 FecR domain-containing protein [Thalassomonas actiniarum]
MSNIHQIHERAQDEEQRLDAASDWIAKLDRGLSPGEQQQLKAWLAQDVHNTAVLLEIAQLWDKMAELSRLSDIFPQAPVKKKKNAPWLVSIAASLVLAFGFYLGKQTFFPAPLESPSAVVAIQASYQTGIGESNTINLPDSSKIVLNTNSFVQVKYTENARIIELQRGEIHIDVAHDKSRPLSVIAGGEIIQAVGTAFNVEVRDELVELIVTDGKVLVAKEEKSSLNALLDNDLKQLAKRLPPNAMLISKGEKINLDVTGKSQQAKVKIDPVEIAASLSWRNGNLIFRGESLAEAMAEISRYTQIEFELDSDKNLEQIQVAGMFKTGDVTGLLDVLSRNFNISYEKVSHDKIFLKYAG